jgi:predicted lipoprotein with Yx(FWY)xxD motif
MKKLYACLVACGVLFSLIMTGCRKSSDNNPEKQIRLAASASLGNYLVDKDGRTIYVFANDANGTSSCSGGCEAIWPAFNVTGLTSADLGNSSLLIKGGHCTCFLLLQMVIIHLSIRAKH